MANKLIRLTESDLHRIVKESVEIILAEVEGYQDTMTKANPVFNKNTIGGKVRRFFNPRKAKQFDRIHGDASKRFYDAERDQYNNRSESYPSAFDPRAVPDQDAIDRSEKNWAVMSKYNLGPNGFRNSRYEDYKQQG